MTPNSDKLPEDGQQSLEYRVPSKPALKEPDRRPFYGLLSLASSILGYAVVMSFMAMIEGYKLKYSHTFFAALDSVVLFGPPTFGIIFAALGIRRATRCRLRSEFIISILGAFLGAVIMMAVLADLTYPGKR